MRRVDETIRRGNAGLNPMRRCPAMIVKQILAMKSGPDEIVTIRPDTTVAEAASGTCGGVSIAFSGAWASAAATTAGAGVEAGGAPASCARPGVAASAARTTIWKRRTGNPSSCIGSAIAKPRAKVNLGAGFPDISNPVPWADRRPPLPRPTTMPAAGQKRAGIRRPSCPRAACPPSCRPSRRLSGLCARPCPRPSRPP